MRLDESNVRKPMETAPNPDLSGTTGAMHRTARRAPPPGGEGDAHRRVQRQESGPGERG